MSMLKELKLRPNSAPRLASEATLAEWMMFLLGRQATFGQAPPLEVRVRPQRYDGLRRPESRSATYLRPRCRGQGFHTFQHRAFVVLLETSHCLGTGNHARVVT